MAAEKGQEILAKKNEYNVPNYLLLYPDMGSSHSEKQLI
jgi:hypothetical protein